MSPSTLIVFGGSGLGAGGLTTEPSVIEYLLPWQGQLIVSVTVSTMTALVRADCAERLELTLLWLGDHRLGVGKDLAAADRYVCFLDA